MLAYIILLLAVSTALPSHGLAKESDANDKMCNSTDGTCEVIDGELRLGL